MTPEQTDIAEQPARPAKKKARRKVSDKPVPVRGGEFAGLSATDCCADCTEDRCVITTVALCGHPFKASLHNAGPKTKAKIMEARKLIRHQKIDARG